MQGLEISIWEYTYPQIKIVVGSVSANMLQFSILSYEATLKNHKALKTFHLFTYHPPGHMDQLLLT